MSLEKHLQVRAREVKDAERALALALQRRQAAAIRASEAGLSQRAIAAHLEITQAAVWQTIKRAASDGAAQGTHKEES